MKVSWQWGYTYLSPEKEKEGEKRKMPPFLVNQINCASQHKKESEDLGGNFVELLICPGRPVFTIYESKCKDICVTESPIQAENMHIVQLEYSYILCCWDIILCSMCTFCKIKDRKEYKSV